MGERNDELDNRTRALGRALEEERTLRDRVRDLGQHLEAAEHDRDVALERRNFWKTAAEKSHQQLAGEQQYLDKWREDARTAKGRLATLEGALEPLRNEIVEAAEIDTRWEEVAKAAGWLESDKGRGWYQQDPIWHFIEDGRAACGEFSVNNVELIEKLATDSGGLACIECIIHVMPSQPEAA